MKINYWWSSDKKWFCVLLDDGSNKMTISLPPDEASLLSMNAYPPKDEPSSAQPAPADDAAVAWRWPRALAVYRSEQDVWHGDVSFARYPSDDELLALGRFLNSHHENTHPAKAVDVEAVKRFAAVVRVMESANSKRANMNIWDEDLAAAKAILTLLTTGNASSETEGGK